MIFRNCRSASKHAGGGPAQRHLPGPPALHVALGAADDLDGLVQINGAETDTQDVGPRLGWFERYTEMRPDEAALESILGAGAEEARAISSVIVADVRDAMGIGPPRA